MARSRTLKEGEEHLETTDGEIPDVTLPPIVNDAPVIGDATKHGPARKAVATAAAPVNAPVVKVRYFRVERGGYILDRGYRTRLREGKVVDSLNYDPAKLQGQGIRLTEIKPEDRGSFTGSTFDQ